jgi:hypothetical protein
MPPRLLNTASVVCLVLCVALMGMWVRSYRAYGPSTVLSIGKAVLVAAVHRGHAECVWQWKFRYGPTDEYAQHTILNSIGFEVRRNAGSIVAAIPFWFLVVASGSLAMAFQLRWPPRFTLRALFFATTFLAVVLGMSAWLDRAWIGK